MSLFTPDERAQWQRSYDRIGVELERAASAARAAYPDIVQGGLVRHRSGHPSGRPWFATVDGLERPCQECPGARACLSLGQGGRSHDVRWCAHDWQPVAQETLF